MMQFPGMEFWAVLVPGGRKVYRIDASNSTLNLEGGGHPPLAGELSAPKEATYLEPA